MNKKCISNQQNFNLSRNTWFLIKNVAKKRSQIDSFAPQTGLEPVTLPIYNRDALINRANEIFNIFLAFFIFYEHFSGICFGSVFTLFCIHKNPRNACFCKIWMSSIVPINSLYNIERATYIIFIKLFAIKNINVIHDS